MVRERVLVQQVIDDGIPEELPERRERREKKPSFNRLRPTIWFALTIITVGAIVYFKNK